MVYIYKLNAKMRWYCKKKK